jgi:hypothetical protein
MGKRENPLHLIYGVFMGEMLFEKGSFSQLNSTANALQDALRKKEQKAMTAAAHAALARAPGRSLSKKILILCGIGVVAGVLVAQAIAFGHAAKEVGKRAALSPASAVERIETPARTFFNGTEYELLTSIDETGKLSLQIEPVYPKSANDVGVSLAQPLSSQSGKATKSAMLGNEKFNVAIATDEKGDLAVALAPETPKNDGDKTRLILSRYPSVKDATPN